MPEFRQRKTAGAMARWDPSGSAAAPGGPGAGRRPSAAPCWAEERRECGAAAAFGIPGAPHPATPRCPQVPTTPRNSGHRRRLLCCNNAALSCHLPFPHFVRSVLTAQDSRIKCFGTNIGNTAANWEGADANSGEPRARPVPAESYRAGRSSPSLRHAWQAAP